MPLEGVSPYSSSITCWYRIPVTAYTGWHGQNLLGLPDNGETRLRERRSMCYIARSLLYGSFCPLSLRLSLSLFLTFEMRRGDTSTLIVDLTSAIVSVAIGRCFVSSFFPSPFLFFRTEVARSNFFPYFRSFSRAWRETYICIYIYKMISFGKNLDFEIWVFFFGSIGFLWQFVSI